MIVFFKERLAAIRFKRQRHDPLDSDVKEIDEIDSSIDFDLDEAALKVSENDFSMFENSVDPLEELINFDDSDNDDSSSSFDDSENYDSSSSANEADEPCTQTELDAMRLNVTNASHLSYITETFYKDLPGLLADYKANEVKTRDHRGQYRDHIQVIEDKFNEILKQIEWLHEIAFSKPTPPLEPIIESLDKMIAALPNNEVEDTRTSLKQTNLALLNAASLNQINWANTVEIASEFHRHKSLLDHHQVNYFQLPTHKLGFTFQQAMLRKMLLDKANDFVLSNKQDQVLDFAAFQADMDKSNKRAFKLLENLSMASLSDGEWTKLLSAPLLTLGRCYSFTYWHSDIKGIGRISGERVEAIIKCYYPASIAAFTLEMSDLLLEMAGRYHSFFSYNSGLFVSEVWSEFIAILNKKEAL